MWTAASQRQEWRWVFECGRLGPQKKKKSRIKREKDLSRFLFGLRPLTISSIERFHSSRAEKLLDPDPDFWGLNRRPQIVLQKKKVKKRKFVGRFSQSG